MKPRFFKSQTDFRAWLEKHGTTERELWVGYYKKGTGKSGLVYQQALDEALCFGWIDGIVKRVDDISYMQRWTPRTRTSSWSVVNTKRVGELTRLGLMAPPGLKAFRERDLKRSAIYLYEQKDRALDPKFQKALKANKTASAFFEAQPPGYRRLAIMYIMTAKKEETRQKRFDAILKAAAAKTRTRWM
jgi:uncharacterized protein YdeI (YjbR/CyaY-like superfamily)